MPDFIDAIRGGPSDVGANAAASTGIALTAHATTHTMGSWVELIAATTHETTLVLVTLTDTSTPGTGYLVDIGVGAAAAEQILIPKLLSYNSVAAQPIPRTYLLPIAIAKGERISARCQSATTVATIKVAIQCFSGPITGRHGVRRVETAGISTANSNVTLIADPGATPHTDGGWTQLIAATTFHWRWVCVAVTTTDAAAGAITSFLFDLGVGASSSEVAFVNDLWVLSHTATDHPVPGTYCFPCSIASGSRVSARHRESTGTASDRRLSIGLYGVG